MGAFHQVSRFQATGKLEIGENLASLAVNPRVDAMRKSEPLTAKGNSGVVGCRAQPDTPRRRGGVGAGYPLTWP